MSFLVWTHHMFLTGMGTVLGGLTGLPLGLASSDIPLHDTMYVVGHFHYVVAPGTIFALFAGIYYWYPKITGRMMNEALGWIHFVGSFICMNLILFPMLMLGLAGVNRRLYDGGMQYAHAQPLHGLQVAMSPASWALTLFQVPFVWNLFASLKFGRIAEGNPWHATTLEWTAAHVSIWLGRTILSASTSAIQRRATTCGRRIN